MQYRCANLILLLAATVAAQQPHFAAVSLKPAGQARPGSLRATFDADPNGIHHALFTLQGLILKSYGLQYFQLQGGDNWTSQDLFALDATTVHPANHDQLMAMLRDVLATRFALSLTNQPRPTPVLALEVAPDGPQLQPISPGEFPAFASIPRGAAADIEINSVQDLVGLLNTGNKPLGRFVVDRTGLTGNYKILLAGAAPRVETENGREAYGVPSLESARAALKPLGLILKDETLPLDTYTITTAHHPNPNE